MSHQLPPANPQLAMQHLLREAGITDYRETKFMEALIDEGYISLQEVTAYINQSRNRGMSLVEYAQMSLDVAEVDLTRLNATAYSLPVVDLALAPRRRQVAEGLKATEAFRMMALPFDVDDQGRVLVALADPSNIQARSRLPQLLSKQVAFYAAMPSQVREALEEFYPDYDPVDREAEEIQQLAAEAASSTKLDIRTRDTGEDAPVVRLLNRIVQEAHDRGASDIHTEIFETRTFLRYRVNGVLRDASIEIPMQIYGNVVSRIKIMASLDISEKRLPQDGRAQYRLSNGVALDMRIAVVPTVYGECVVIRLLDPSSVRVPVEKLGMTKRNRIIFEKAIAKPWGAVIMTGPTGSGKTTTLYSALNQIIDNGKERSRKVWTVEDPVEYRLETVNQIQVNEKANYTFPIALRSLLRADPDIMMVGEIRDGTTAKIAIEASLTGHLVLSTLHTNDAPTVVSRLNEMGVERFLIANSLELVVAQRLARTLCDICRVPVEVDLRFLEEVAHAPRWALDFVKKKGGKVTLYEPRIDPTAKTPCPRCKGEGYKGRTGVHEVMQMTPELRDMVINRASKGELETQAHRDGMFALRDDCFVKVMYGVTSLEELARIVNQ